MIGVSNYKKYLSKEEAEEILQIYLGPSKLIAGNFAYLNGCRAKTFDMKAIQQANQISIEDIQRYLGVKELSHLNLDTHIGQLSDYAWLKIEHPADEGFVSIFDGLAKVKKKYPAEQEHLESISRRLAYLSFLKCEMEYMNKRYDYEEIPIIFEFYENKVEVFTILLVDLLMVLAGLWCDQPGSTIKPGPKPYHFENLFDCLIPLQYGGHQLLDSINMMLELSAAVSARHQFVHYIGPKISLTNDGGNIEFEIPHKDRYDHNNFERYMQHLYNSLEKKLPADSTIIIKDPRFPEFDFELRRARGGKFHYGGSIVRYSAKVSQYVRMLDRVLGLIADSIIRAILN